MRTLEHLDRWRVPLHGYEHGDQFNGAFLRSLARMPSKQPSLADQLDALGFAMPPSTSKSAADDFVRDVPIE